LFIDCRKTAETKVDVVKTTAADVIQITEDLDVQATVPRLQQTQRFHQIQTTDPRTHWTPIQPPPGLIAGVQKARGQLRVELMVNSCPTTTQRVLTSAVDAGVDLEERTTRTIHWTRTTQVDQRTPAMMMTMMMRAAVDVVVGMVANHPDVQATVSRLQQIRKFRQIQTTGPRTR